MSTDAADVRARVLTDVTAASQAHRARLRDAQDALRAVFARVDAMRSDHEAACREARERHRTLPPEPAYPDVTAAQELVHRLHLEAATLSDRERDALAAALPDVEQAWQDARPALEADAVALMGDVEAYAARYVAWWSLLHAARTAAEHGPNLRVTNGPSARMGERPEPVAALLAGSRGLDLCAPTPVRRDQDRDPIRQRVYAGEERVR